jgi:hypothetical protein
VHQRSAQIGQEYREQEIGEIGVQLSQAGVIWFAVLKVRSPQTLTSIQHDMEG